jgi:hypothetical protein
MEEKVPVMDETRNAYNILFGMPKQFVWLKRIHLCMFFGRISDIEDGHMNWVKLVQSKFECYTFVNNVMNNGVQKEAGMS